MAGAGPPRPVEVLSVHGETVRLVGQGLYRHEAVFFGASFRGQDLVTPVLAAPLLALAAWRARIGDGGWVLWRTALLA